MVQFLPVLSKASFKYSDLVKMLDEWSGFSDLKKGNESIADAAAAEAEAAEEDEDEFLSALTAYTAP